MAEPQAYALDAAYDRASANPDTLAPPFVDMVTGEVIIPAATADGHSVGSATLAGTAYLGLGSTDWTLPGSYTGPDGDEDDAAGQAGSPEAYSFTPVVRDVATSYARLRTIIREVLTATPAQLPDADKIVGGGISPDRNQVMFTVTAVSPALRQALAQRYGTNSVVLVLNPAAASARQSQPSTAGRAGEPRRRWHARQ
ncbi:hypothetical protein [Nonomuraea candida]|uniref:hypothetical protein n=1 Tax=Nonomuraea candida TaxID=359159 RepID=UPI0005BC3A26|nr:hypothetical protein [Nonomuraea candida]